MKIPRHLTDAGLERLLTQTPVPNELSRRDLIARLREEEAKLGLEIKVRTMELWKKRHETEKTSVTQDDIQQVQAQVGPLENLKEKVAQRLAQLRDFQTGITSITIENFKGIGPAVVIPLRAITLLFGANGAGKSSIVQALHYARELLERNNANPDRTLTGGDAIAMGGFWNLVHKHDLQKEIRIRIEITPTADGVPTLDDILGTVTQERDIRVSAEWIRRRLAETAFSGTPFASAQRAFLDSLRQSLEPLLASTTERVGRSKDDFERRMRKLVKWQILLPPLEWQQFIVRILEAKPDAKGQIRLNVEDVQKLIAHYSSDSTPAAEAIREQLREKLVEEFHKVWKAFSEEDLSSLESAYHEQLAAVFEQTRENAMKASLRLESARSGAPLADDLKRLMEVQHGLNINRHIDTVSIELVARWDEVTQRGWFAECRYFLNGQSIITIQKPKPNAYPSIETIDFFHPVMLAMDGPLQDDLPQYRRELARLRLEFKRNLKQRLLKENASPTLGVTIVRPNSEYVVAHKDETLTPELFQRLGKALPDVICLPGDAPVREEIEAEVRRFQEHLVQLRKRWGLHPSIQLTDAPSVAPDPNRALPFQAEVLGESREIYFDVINQIVVGITALVRKYLAQFRYIGPIRAIPERNHEAPPIEDPSRWASGLAAWDLLLQRYDPEGKRNADFIAEVSKWLGAEDRLALGYRIEVTGFRSIAEDSQLMHQLKRLQAQYDEWTAEDFREKILKPLLRQPQLPRIRIIDTRTGTEVGPKDIGIGVAQSLPIVVGALDSKCSFLAVEQPELHLHPRVACNLADLFIAQSAKGKLYLIESHSEHLMLRLKRRIREKVISAGDVSVLFVEAPKTGGRTIITPLKLDSEGEFIDEWPGGFFEEDFDEIFGKDK